MTIGVYLIRNTVNGKVYVGSSNNVEKRFGGHRHRLRKGIHSSCHLQEAWRKYGEESFVFILKRTCEESRLLEIEQEYMDLYLSPDHDCGYNICEKAGRPPSRKGVSKSPETRRRMSEAAIERGKSAEYRKSLSEGIKRGGGAWNKGIKHPPERIEIYRQRSTGKKHSEETLAKMRAWQSVHNPSKGVVPSIETRLLKSKKTAMFSAEQALEMRSLWSSGVSIMKISKMFACSHSCASRVIKGDRLAYKIAE